MFIFSCRASNSAPAVLTWVATSCLPSAWASVAHLVIWYVYKSLKKPPCPLLLSLCVPFFFRPGSLVVISLQLPIELGKCKYEKGSDGQMLTYLTSPELMSVRLLDSEWSATGVLDIVAQADPPFHALIDTGALITGMSNLEGMQLASTHRFLLN